MCIQLRNGLPRGRHCQVDQTKAKHRNKKPWVLYDCRKGPEKTNGFLRLQLTLGHRTRRRGYSICFLRLGEERELAS